MRILRQGYLRHAFFLLIASLGLGLAGCEGDDGLAGSDGTNGVDGADGAAGQACWDLNNNGVGDPDEDINGDGVIDVYDCNAYASGAYEIFVIGVDGSAPTQITSLFGSNGWYPVYHPAGSLLSFSTERAGVGRAPVDLSRESGRIRPGEAREPRGDVGKS